MRSDSEWAKKEAKRDRRTAYACKLADLESSQLIRYQKEGTEGGSGEEGMKEGEEKEKIELRQCSCFAHS